jgi:hypothetical protein
MLAKLLLGGFVYRIINPVNGIHRVTVRSRLTYPALQGSGWGRVPSACGRFVMFSQGLHEP